MRVPYSGSRTGWPVFRSTDLNTLTVSSILLAETSEPSVRSERVDDAVPVRMGQELAVLAVLVLLVRQHHHVDAGVIPLVVRGLLVAELGLTRIGVAAEDGHRPLVVAGTHGLVPRRRVAGAEVDQVGAGIVGVPAPVGAAADLPGIALPGGGAEVLLAVMGVLDVEVGGEQQVLVRAGRVGAPDLGTGLHVVGGEVAAHAELGARGADDDLVLHHVGGDRQRGADLDVGILDLPHRLAGLGVERHDVAVEQGLEDQRRGLSVAGPVGETAIDEIAAGDGAGGRVLLGLVLPQDLARIVEGESKGVVREGGVDIHLVVDDDGRALVAVEQAGRERPGDLEVLHVRRVDLLELAVIVRVVVLARHHPVFIAVRQIDELVVGRGDP